MSLAIVLAAGKGTRMKSALPKVLHPICGRPMAAWVVDAVRDAGATRIVMVVGHEADRVREAFSEPDIEFALQSKQLGTGHAVMMCAEQLAGHTGSVFVLAGDTPLLNPTSLQALQSVRDRAEAACVIGTAITAENEGLGRIVRGQAGGFERIVEHKDATPDQRKIEEINTGCYIFEAAALRDSLEQLKPENEQAEYYLTDCPAILLREGKPVHAHAGLTIEEAMGVNTRAQASAVGEVIQRRIQESHMLAGVTIEWPGGTYIDARAKIGAESVLHPFTTIEGAAEIGEGCEIGPHAVVTGTQPIPAGTRLPPFSVR